MEEVGENSTQSNFLNMKILEVNYLRFFAIVSIVVWHCFSCPTCKWGLLEPSNYTNSVSFISSIFIPEANMPLFMCLSGYLFSHLLKLKKPAYTSFKRLLNNKIHRLVIPFFIIGSIGTMAVPERPASGILWGDGSSMWFCIVLFWLFIFRFLVLKYIKNKSILFAIFIACTTVYIIFLDYMLPHWTYGIPTGLLCFSRTFYYYPFFVLGDIIYKHRGYLSRFKVSYLLIILFFYLLCSIIQQSNLNIFIV